MVHPLCSIEMMDVTGNVIRLYCTYVHYSRKNRRGHSTPSRCTTGWRFRRRGRRAALLAARPGSAARGGPVRAAPAGGRGGAPGGGGWPGLSRAGTPGSAAPDGPEAALCAGVAWIAGAMVRVSGRHCAGRGQAPARAWREFEVGAWCTLSACATRLSAPSGAYAPLRSKTRYAQLRRHLPQGSCKVWGQLADSLAPRGSQRAIACMSAQRGGCWVARPACTLGCHSGSAGLPAHCWGSWGRCPQTPGRRSPSRVGVGGEVEGPHCGAVQDRRAARDSLA